MLLSSRGKLIRRIGFIFVENLLISLFVLLAVAVRSLVDGSDPLAYSLIYYKAFLIASICQLSFYYNDLYAIRLLNQPREWAIKFIQSLAAAAILLAVVYYLFPSLIIGRGIFLITLFLLPLAVIGWRWTCDRLSRIGPLRDRVVIIGSGSLARKIGEEVLQNHPGNYEIVGFVDEDPKKLGESVVNPKVIGDYSVLSAIVSQHNIDRVIVALQDRRGKLPVNVLLECKFQGTWVEDGVNFYERLVGKIIVENLKPSWFIFSSGFRQYRLARMAKRGMDVLLATAALLASFPLFLIIALLIRMDSPGPVFFRQERVGEAEKIFTLLKFRSMRVDAEAATGPVWAQHQDSRTTAVGRFLRRTRLDELPQLINVLKGDMSFVGPRPERPFFVAVLLREIPYYAVRHTVKPGITGWAQIKYSYGASMEDALEKLQYDLFYIKNLSIWLDLTIIFETIKVVLLRRGSR
ncbi:MAG TPA: TIGR03013 family XrtA/PEP-CTERM system glycosyltransferase [Nitrospiria bacterium]|nr:TIGR03013 family XrtA/PEP-CTERM system glycosyltransferase [Nitrospiria bacterium]HUK56117.1 TIGR03013 family XrtA/PEP-CTERM system glycosyltransferase [Nitrospiria bacterium]